MMDKKSLETNKVLKVRIYPTDAQERVMKMTLGACRFIYNNYLQERSEFYIEHILPVKKSSTKQQLSEIYKTFKRTSDKEYGQLYPWMKETSSTARHEATRHLDSAYSRFFDNCKKHRKVGRKHNPYGFPQFKSKKDSHQSYSDRITDFDWSHRAITIPKCGKLRFRNAELPRWFDGSTRMNGSVTISKSASGRWYASILFTVRNKQYETCNRKQAVGLDFSPEFCYVDSDGNTGKDFGYVAQKQSNAKKLKHLQRAYARKINIQDTDSPRKHPSKNKEKARTKLARLEERISDKRKDWIEKETLRLVRTYDKVVVEDLNLKGISSFLRNAKNMNDTSWATFVSRLETKGKDYGCLVIKADRYFASSQICSKCGYQNHTLTLRDRMWTCPDCSSTHVRDVNAAVNLRNYVPLGRRELTPVESEGDDLTALLAVQAITLDEAGTTTGDFVGESHGSSDRG